jgi:hypothetical protein
VIVQWFIQLAQGFASWVVSLFPVLDLPDGLVNVDSTINDLFSTWGAGMAPLADWPFVTACVAIPLAVWGSGLLVRAIRALIAHLPYVGGKG